MAGIKHAFESGKSDDADATLVNPSNWNDEHEPNLTTKGDIIVEGASAAERLGVGAEGTHPVSRAAESGGIAYESHKRTYVWFIRGSLVAGTEQGPTFRIDEACTILDVRLHVKTAPTGANLIVDINEAGGSIFSTKSEIDAGDTTEDDNHVVSDSALADNAELTADLDQVGSSVAGADLTIEIEVSVP